MTEKPFGHPTDYKPEYCQMLIDHLSEGYIYESFAGKVNVAWKTLYNWERQNPEFLQAKEIGMSKGMEYDEHMLKAGTLGLKKLGKGEKAISVNINPTLMIFKLKNRYRQHYNERQIIEMGNLDGNIFKLQYKTDDDSEENKQPTEPM